MTGWSHVIMSPAPEIRSHDTCTIAAFLAGVPCALCLVAEDDRLGLCNDRFARLFETTPERVLDRAVTEFISESLWRQAGRQSDHAGVAGDCLRGPGNPFHAELFVRPFPGRNHAWRLITIHACASRENHLEGLATLAGGVAHEFNNVLSVVLGYGALLPDMATDPASLRTTAGHIMGAARRGADVVYQLQLFARTAECARTPHHLHQLVRDAVAHTARHWPESITVELALTPGPDLLMLNAPQLILALQYLLKNAREALPLETGAITLRTTHHPDLTPPSLCLCVEDTGVGMDATTRHRALEPFFTKHRAGMRGLGLTVVHGIVKAHDGTMEITSTPRGGARIHLWFPCPAADPNAPDLPLSFVAAEHQQGLLEAAQHVARGNTPDAVRLPE